jgi:hypothetical protein
MLRSPRSRGLAALLAIAALALSACTNNDADAGDVADALTDAGLAEDQAQCVGEGFEAEFDQDQMNDLASADEPEDWPSGTEETVDSIIDECTGEGGSGSDESETTTTTTEAG